MKMKKIKYIGIVAIVAISFTSCKKYLDDVAVNPNAPENVGPKVLLSSVEVATFSNFTGNNARRSAIFTQHISGTGFQMSDLAAYSLHENDVVTDWQTIYSGALVNAQIIIDKYGSENPYYSGMAKVLKAMNLGLATDMWGDIPEKEALKGAELSVTPHFDDQQTVLADIQAILSDAITDLQKSSGSNVLFPGADDYMFGGNTNAWIEIAYVLKARYENRLSEVSPASSATAALADLTAAYAAGFASNADDAQAKFGPNGSENNQWAAFNSSRADYIKMGAFFIDTMNATGDPRLPFFADTLAGGVYAGGALSNAIAGTSSDIGIYCDDVAANMPLVTYVEAKFIEAECKLRSGDALGAAAAHNEAVKASMLAVTGGPDATYEAAHASETILTITLNKIMMEKYIALFTQVETWTDWRRTNIPNLMANPSGAVSGIPRRLPTSADERLYNPNATVVGNILQHVWYDL
jgi:hypothetical protein